MFGARKLTTAGPARLINLLKSGRADVQSVEKLLEEGCDLNQLIEVSLRKSVTPLMVACELGQVDIVKLLLERGAEVDKQGSDFWTALIVAVVSENAEVVKVLVEHGADVDYAVGWGDNIAKSPFLLGCEKGLVIMVKAMLPKSKCKFMYTAYIYAMKGDHNEVAQLLLSEVSEVEANAMRLGLFCREGMFGEAKELLEGNHVSPFINYFLEHNASPLMEASGKSQNKMIELLLDNGANINLQNDNGMTALIVAVRNLRCDTVKLLLDKGANADLKMRGGNTALVELILYASDSATEDKVTKIIQLLVEHADVNIQNDKGQTALTMVMGKRKSPLKAVQLLMDRNARTDVVDKFYGPPLHAAAEKGHTEVVKLLLEKGAAIDFQDKNGKSALIVACKERQTKISKLLIEKGANVNLVDNVSRYALLYAAAVLKTQYISAELLSELWEVVQLLIEKGANADHIADTGESAATLLQTALQQLVSVSLRTQVHYEVSVVYYIFRNPMV